MSPLVQMWSFLKTRTALQAQHGSGLGGNKSLPCQPFPLSLLENLLIQSGHRRANSAEKEGTLIPSLTSSFLLGLWQGFVDMQAELLSPQIVGTWGYILAPRGRGLFSWEEKALGQGWILWDLSAKPGVWNQPCSSWTGSSR